MEEIEFAMSASGGFGNFMWEYPEDVKKIFRALSQNEAGDVVSRVIEEQKRAVSGLLHLMCSILHAGEMAPVLAGNTMARLSELAAENVSILMRHRMNQ